MTYQSKYTGAQIDEAVGLALSGELDVTLQEKTITPTESTQEIIPDEGIDGLSKVTVEAIPTGYIVPSGEIAITTNGLHDVTNYATAAVTIVDSAIPAEVGTEEEMNALVTDGEANGIYKYTGETTETYENGELYQLNENEVDDSLAGTWVFNETLNAPDANLAAVLSFINNETIFYRISVSPSMGITLKYHTEENGSITAHVSDSWVDESYKTIKIISTFADLISLNDETKANTLLTWLQANATKTVTKFFTKLIKQTDLEELTATENGEYLPTEDGFSKVTVAIPVYGGDVEDIEPPEEALLGTWTLKAQPFNNSMVTAEACTISGNITGIAEDTTSLTTYMNIGVKTGSFGLFDSEFFYGLLFLEPYPNVYRVSDGLTISNADANIWSTLSTFTINSVTSTDTEALNLVYAFLQANATKQ